MPTENYLSLNDSILVAKRFGKPEPIWSLSSTFSLSTVDLPSKYIINNEVTVLIWKDGSKTIVRKTEEDEFNPRLAFLTAFFQHYSGLSKNKANKFLANLQVQEGTTKKTKSDSELNVGDRVRVESLGNANGTIIQINNKAGTKYKYKIKFDASFLLPCYYGENDLIKIKEDK